MKFTITKKFILAKAVDKGTVNLYTLLDVEDFSKIVAIGVKTVHPLPERALVEVDINLRTKSNRFELKTGETKYVEEASTFVSSVKVLDGTEK